MIRGSLLAVALILPGLSTAYELLCDGFRSGCNADWLESEAAIADSWVAQTEEEARDSASPELLNEVYTAARGIGVFGRFAVNGSSGGDTSVTGDYSSFRVRSEAWILDYRVRGSLVFLQIEQSGPWSNASISTAGAVFRLVSDGSRIRIASTPSAALDILSSHLSVRFILADGVTWERTADLDLLRLRLADGASAVLHIAGNGEFFPDGRVIRVELADGVVGFTYLGGENGSEMSADIPEVGGGVNIVGLLHNDGFFSNTLVYGNWTPTVTMESAGTVKIDIDSAPPLVRATVGPVGNESLRVLFDGRELDRASSASQVAQGSGRAYVSLVGCRAEILVGLDGNESGSLQLSGLDSDRQACASNETEAPPQEPPGNASEEQPDRSNGLPGNASEGKPVYRSNESLAAPRTSPLPLALVLIVLLLAPLVRRHR
ncbi:MAG TPA: hypothetical protein VGR28_04110 [Candidatus Thermoplasmatota archaeon]|jgi:hypothetical protein|nr:hypothetical protein [Candidatus Thermoplasmatota archaeon]